MINVVDRQAVAVVSRGTLMDPEMVSAHPDAAYVLAGQSLFIRGRNFECDWVRLLVAVCHDNTYQTGKSGGCSPALTLPLQAVVVVCNEGSQCAGGLLLDGRTLHLLLHGQLSWSIDL